MYKFRILCIFIFGISLLFTLHFYLNIVQQDSTVSGYNIDHYKSLLEYCHKLPERPNEKIPRITHQSWKTEVLPDNFHRWRATLLSKHPDWDHHLWTDSDNMKFVEEKFPFYFDMFKNFPRNIFRVDSVRALYLYEYGGFYLDLDIKLYRSMDSLIDQYTNSNILFGRMGTNGQFDNSVPNAFMVSIPRHPFWLCYIGKIMERTVMGSRLNPKYYTPEYRTGPEILREAFIDYSKNHNFDYEQVEEISKSTTSTPSTLIKNKISVGFIKLLNESLIYPYNWNDEVKYGEVCSSESPDFNEEKCDVNFKNTAYMISYWSHSWDFMGSGIFIRIKKILKALNLVN